MPSGPSGPPAARAATARPPRRQSRLSVAAPSRRPGGHSCRRRARAGRRGDGAGPSGGYDPRPQTWSPPAARPLRRQSRLAAQHRRTARRSGRQPGRRETALATETALRQGCGGCVSEDGEATQAVLGRAAGTALGQRCGCDWNDREVARATRPSIWRPGRSAAWDGATPAVEGRPARRCLGEAATRLMLGRGSGGLAAPVPTTLALVVLFNEWLGCIA